MKLSDFQALINNLYFSKDKKRGALGTFAWLVEEVGEVANIIKQKNIDEAALGAELADVIAWTFSLANIYGIDLEKAISSKYPLKCGKCGKLPCECIED
ncbi:MAG: MazG nucleotide pyrophosphohydrolase [Promethearchaeota archaeon CR_4]|nr:MAG: MazG nucleotide pyrophosphohydrolase [Candidatus Lokiarchaeota archaeon CR_4]